jgi:hypothetical protein
METEFSSSAGGALRPMVRLSFTLALGMMGVLLFPPRSGFFPMPFAEVQGPAALAWIALVLAGALLSYRLENVPVSRGTYALIAVVATLALMFLRGFGLAWLCLLWLTAVAGASLLRLRLHPGSGALVRTQPLARGPAIALIAPLILFAERPGAGGRAGSYTQTLSRVALTLFPFVLATGWIAAWIPATARQPVGLMGLSFTIWASLGCGLLLVLSPWSGYARLPLLEDRRQELTLGPVGTAAFMTIMVVPVTSMASGPLLYAVSHFASLPKQVGPGHLIQQWFLLFTMFSAIVLPHIAIGRWIGDRGTRAGYWAFTVLAAALCGWLLGVLTIPAWWLVQYIRDMGVTPRRIHGLVYALTGYLAVLGFLAWSVSWRKPRQHVEARGFTLRYKVLVDEKRVR